MSLAFWRKGAPREVHELPAQLPEAVGPTTRLINVHVQARMTLNHGDAYIRCVDLLDVLNRVREGYGLRILSPAHVTDALSSIVRDLMDKVAEDREKPDIAEVVRHGAHAATDSGDDLDGDGHESDGA